MSLPVDKTIAICLMGPTAVGKTAVALKIADQLPVEIISVDSALVYKGLDIGSGKPEQEILHKYPHKLVDICEPNCNYSVAKFCDDAKLAINNAAANNKIPLLVGGTMLYYKGLQQGLSPLPATPRWLRQLLTNLINRKGLEFFYNKLRKIDPLCASKLNPNDPQRISRALEVYYASGQTMSFWQQQKTEQAEIDFVNISLIPETTARSKLHGIIEHRFDQMLEQGLVDEVQNLFKRKDLNTSHSAIRSVGYRQVWEYLSGYSDFQQMRESAICATRQLAKRQLTWLRKWPNITNYDFCDPHLSNKLITQITSRVC